MSYVTTKEYVQELKKQKDSIEKLLLESSDDFHRGYYYGMFIQIESVLDDIHLIYKVEDTCK